MDNNKIDPRAFQAETVYEQQMAGVLGAGPSMANEAASVAALDQAVEAWYDAQYDTNGMDWTDESRYRMQAAIDAYEAHVPQPASVAQLTDEQIVLAGMNHFSRCEVPEAMLSYIAAVRECLALGAQAAPPADDLDRVLEGEFTSADDLIDSLREAAPPAAPAQGDALTQDALRAALQLIAETFHGQTGTAATMQGIARSALLAAPAAPATGGSGAEPYRQRSARLSAGRLSDAERAAIEAIYATPPAAEAASQPGEMGAEVPESTNQGEQKCQSKLNVMLLRSVAPVTQDNTSLGDVSRSTSIGAANSMVGSAIRTGDGEAQNYRTADGMPTERAVLEREWRKMRDQLAALPAASAQQVEREALTAEFVMHALRDAIADMRAIKCDVPESASLIGYFGNRIRAAQQVQAGGEDKRDTERLDWLAQHGAWVAWGRDGEFCRVFHHSDDEDGRAVPFCGWGAGKCYPTAREAIDAALSREQPQPSNGDREGGAS